MAWTSGTAAGHTDYLAKLKTFLETDATLVAEGQNWAVEEWTPSGYGDSEIPSGYSAFPAGAALGRWPLDALLIVRGPGSSAGDAVYGAIGSVQTNGLTNGLANNLMVWGLTGYIAGEKLGAQPGRTEGKALPLVNTSIDYWFFANGRRVIMMAKIGTSYYGAYMGWGLPYATPTEHPYPYYVGAAINTRVLSHNDYGFSALENNSFWAPVSDTSSPTNWESAEVYSPGVGWMPVACRYETNGNDNPVSAGSNAERVLMWPTGRIFTQTAPSLTYFNCHGACVDGSPQLFPISFFHMSSNSTYMKYRYEEYVGALMELDGVYQIFPDNTPLPEQEITIGSNTYILFPSGTNQSRLDFAAILKA